MPIHSDLPLWGSKKSDQVWPKSFRDAELFGCTHRIETGDWKRGEARSLSFDVEWIRLSNYGAMHCFLVEGRSYGQAGLDTAEGKISLLIELGRMTGADGEVELWALQSGARPGSDYTLLSRKPGPGLITMFNVLQQQCPRRLVRESNALDIARTDYCAVNSQRDLRDFARAMSKLPPEGTLIYVPPSEEEPAD